MSGVLAVDLIERWRDLGPVLWLVAGALGVAWLAVLGVLAAITEPRRVKPGAATLEFAGAEPPAVVNLITRDWELGHEAVPATLVDLAARRQVSIDQIGGRTLVRARTHRRDEQLTTYEQMVFDHLRRLGEHTEDGFVPGEALTTGPEASAKGWWKRFTKEVHLDARARGLSAPRWSPAHRLVLIAVGLVVAGAVALAASTISDDSNDSDDSDDDPITLALALGGVTAAATIAAAGALRGERDTPAGRDAAARWLGLRTMLDSDPLFAEQGPAAVAVWDRHLAHGAALGVAHGAVHALPLGAESDRQAWSAVGGRWRLVRIRYPRVFPPGYGRHPALVAFKGLVLAGVGVALVPASAAAAQAVRDLVTDSFADGTLPPGVRLGIGVAVAAVAAGAGILVAVGATMLVAGVGDLARGRRSVEGPLLRLRLRGSDDSRFWHVAVDEGASDRVRAWRMSSAPAATQGDTVAARVSPWLAHVRDFHTLSAGANDEVEAATDVSTENLVIEPEGPPPPLPDDRLISMALGRTVHLDPSASPYPLARHGAGAVYRGNAGLAVQMVWLPIAAFDMQRRLPKLLRSEVQGLGDEAYRMRFGGALTARRDRDALLVMVDGPGLDNDERDRITAAVAKAAFELSAPTSPGSG